MALWDRLDGTFRPGLPQQHIIIGVRGMDKPHQGNPAETFDHAI
jgi:hypothetical protein